MRKRIWELDAVRGILLGLMVYVHVMFDLVELFGVVSPAGLGFYDFCRRWTGILFITLSGVCATLGAHPVKRGLFVLAGGLCVTAVTAGMYLLGMAGRDILIYFGVLHCLGLCMLCWALLRHIPAPVRLVLGVGMIALGIYFLKAVRVDTWALIPLGLLPPRFISSDYFPLLPNLGYFLIGSFLGNTVYRKKAGLLPESWGQNFVSRFFAFCGRHSLTIYLLHQPLIYGVIAAILFILGRVHT